MVSKRIIKINSEYAKILKFIFTSDFFKYSRHNYEQKIVSWQINFMMNRKEGWITDDLIDWLPDCDIKFRQAIINTLLAIGIDKEAIEEGIEKNANIWRNHYIKKAFHNQYDNPMHHINFCDLYKDIKLMPAKEEYKEKWIKLRKYEYYHRHLESVTKYGNIEELVDLKMTIGEIIQLPAELEIMHIERMDEIE